MGQCPPPSLLVGTFIVGQKRVGEPTGVLPDAVCGTHLCGEAICGTWWAFACTDGLLLGAHVPAAHVETADTILAAGLRLGASVPDAVGQFQVPLPGLRLGAVVPSVFTSYSATPDPAGLLFGAVVPDLTISSSIVVSPAGLLLGTYLPTASALYMVEALCVDLELVPAASSSMDLDPQECR